MQLLRELEQRAQAACTPPTLPELPGYDPRAFYNPDPATDAAIVDAAIRDERGTANLSEASLQASTPTLFDGVDDEGLVLAGGFNVGFATGDLTAIEYIGTAWTLTTGDGSLQIDAVEPELDPSLR